jgi:alpha-glucosidase
MLTSLVLALAIGADGLPTTKPDEPIGKPPAEINKTGYYAKAAVFRGIPIVATAKVDDQAFRVLIRRFTKMLERVPDEPLIAMRKAGSYYIILGKDEGQTDPPEYAQMRNDPKTDWNKRARGLGGLITSGGEENILELPVDRYRGESIYIHEFAHTLCNYAFRPTDPDFMPELRRVFKEARDKKLWDNTYSATNYDEYWAEGVQMYFDCARSAPRANGVHNEVCNREGLKAYDPGLFSLIDRKFGQNPWRYDGAYSTTGQKASLDQRSPRKSGGG